jgi:hypothetical protein
VAAGTRRGATVCPLDHGALAQPGKVTPGRGRADSGMPAEIRDARGHPLLHEFDQLLPSLDTNHHCARSDGAR